ncbi:molybdenum cofactor guanylyltransferase [Dyella sp. 2HG41-7]|uniref:molybdenum cofactor guanylyltransferase n=1 Tax=Dyella sp. 2HG41-7 TaxID=2883239 RepID=UPI001F15ABE3|nr:molybdenum cofactor guanylyltransferase [Dyella sp. 2HG41-7]
MTTAIEPARCIGVVLAGGLSSRMGRDKALLPWHGRPLIEHQIALLKAAGANEVKVSGSRPDYHGVADLVPLAGPIGGIASIAAACDDGDLLIVPVDMPRLQASLLQRLLDAERNAACARFVNRVLPMRLRLNASSRGALNALIVATDKRDRSLRALQERIGMVEIALSDDEAKQLIDCNTEETWQEVIA